jgi:hypothetical protein
MAAYAKSAYQSGFLIWAHPATAGCAPPKNLAKKPFSVENASLMEIILILKT